MRQLKPNMQGFANKICLNIPSDNMHVIYDCQWATIIYGLLLVVVVSKPGMPYFRIGFNGL